MSQAALTPAAEDRARGRGGWTERWARRLVLGQLRRLRRGAVLLVEGEGARRLRAAGGRSRSRAGGA